MSDAVEAGPVAGDHRVDRQAERHGRAGMPRSVVDGGVRRADLLATPADGRLVALEVQYSGLTIERWRARHGDDRQRGITDVWLWHLDPGPAAATDRELLLHVRMPAVQAEAVRAGAHRAAPSRLAGRHGGGRAAGQLHPRRRRAAYPDAAPHHQERAVLKAEAAALQEQAALAERERQAPFVALLAERNAHKDPERAREVPEEAAGR